MEPVTTVAGPVSALLRDDVDTDQIIPKQFLKRIERTGYGEFLFHDWIKDEAFELRRPEAEGLDVVLREAGFDWRDPGCSMCLAMNPDKLAPGERCASTSNRNFEGRQGRGGRTHLVSPQMAAAAALHGRFVDVRTLDREPVTA